jgi:hypothetical protein
MGPGQPPMQWIEGEATGLEAEHLCLSNAEVKNGEAIPHLLKSSWRIA